MIMPVRHSYITGTNAIEMNRALDGLAKQSGTA